MRVTPPLLYDCICCPEHYLRIALAWEDPDSGPPCFSTYQDVLSTSDHLASKLSEMVPSNSPIAIFGENCPEVLIAVLAVMTLPRTLKCCCHRMTGGVVRGVACLPVSPRDLPRDHEVILCRCGVETILISLSALEVCKLV